MGIKSITRNSFTTVAVSPTSGPSIMALPVIFAGLRTAAVQIISGAVLAAFIGGGGLGDFITAGIAMMAVPQLLVGAIPVALLALGTDFLFGALQRRMTPQGLRA